MFCISKARQEGPIYIANFPVAKATVDGGRLASHTSSVEENRVKNLKASSAKSPWGLAKLTPFWSIIRASISSQWSTFSVLPSAMPACLIKPCSSFIVKSVAVFLSSSQVVGGVLTLASNISSLTYNTSPSYSRGNPTISPPTLKSARATG